MIGVPGIIISDFYYPPLDVTLIIWYHLSLSHVSLSFYAGPVEPSGRDALAAAGLLSSDEEEEYQEEGDDSEEEPEPSDAKESRAKGAPEALKQKQKQKKRRVEGGAKEDAPSARKKLRKAAAHVAEEEPERAGLDAAAGLFSSDEEEADAQPAVSKPGRALVLEDQDDD